MGKNTANSAKILITARIDVATWNLLREAAEEDRRSLSAMTEILLQKALGNKSSPVHETNAQSDTSKLKAQYVTKAEKNRILGEKARRLVSRVNEFTKNDIIEWYKQDDDNPSIRDHWYEGDHGYVLISSYEGIISHLSTLYWGMINEEAYNDPLVIDVMIETGDYTQEVYKRLVD